MCIVVLTTAHPQYALIMIDNRDEFITRPTSRPEWWSSPHQEILSSRDLLRAEKGTWLGVTKTGNFAVLTNFREPESPDRPPIGARSRGGMVTAWLTAPPEESSREFVHRLLEGEGVKGVGGFSLVCGKLRPKSDPSVASSNEGKQLEELAIISNRCDAAHEVPWIAGKRGEVYGLSNTSYADPIAWPKVTSGEKLLVKAVEESLSKKEGESELVKRLFEILDTDTLPLQNGMPFEKFVLHLRESIFIPKLHGGLSTPMIPSTASGTSTPKITVAGKFNEALRATERPSPDPTSARSANEGAYGTQRQTVFLLDWDGNVKFYERALWDDAGNEIEKGEGDVRFEFKIEDWPRDES